VSAAAALKLSICIATYNRASFIGETLESILPQLTDDVELLVVDGASTDDTPSIMRGFVEKHPRIRYERLPAKGGVDQDYCKAVELARGEYCWLFTDDDLFSPEAVQTVLAAIDRSVGLIVVNAEVKDKALETTIQPRRMPYDADREYEPHEIERLFGDTIEYLSFIGGVVIRRALWLSRERERYFGTEFVHVGVIFQARLPDRAKVVAKPLVTIRYGNAQWTARGFKIWMFQWPELVASLAPIPREAKENAVRLEPWRSLKTLLVERAKGTYSLASFWEHLGPRSMSAAKKAAAAAVSVVPSRPLRWVLRRFAGRTNPFTRYDLGAR
jgi:abequosyltransferase